MKATLEYLRINIIRVICFHFKIQNYLTLSDSSLNASGQGWHHGYAVSEYRLEKLRGSGLSVRDLEMEETSGDVVDNGKDGLCTRTATRSKG